MAVYIYMSLYRGVNWYGPTMYEVIVVAVLSFFIRQKKENIKQQNQFKVVKVCRAKKEGRI